MPKLTMIHTTPDHEDRTTHDVEDFTEATRILTSELSRTESSATVHDVLRLWLFGEQAGQKPVNMTIDIPNGDGRLKMSYSA